MTATVIPETESYQDLEDRLVQAARDMREELIAAQAETEKLTYYPERIHQKFEAAGFYRMLIPKAHGGLEVTPTTFFKVVLEIGRADMSTAWCFTLSANHALMFANWFPEEIHAEVYNAGDFRAASMYAPTAKAEPVEGGYTMNGVVNYCSGIPYSTYFIGQCMLPGKNADGSPRMGLYIAPKDTFTILDDWGHMHGLNGSGSHSIKFDDAFLPERFLLEDVSLIDYAFDGHSPGSKAYSNPMYSGRHMSSFGLGIAVVVLGGAYNLLDEYENQMRTRKTPLPPFIPRTEDPDFQRWYGSALVKIATAEAAVFYALERWLELTHKNIENPGAFTAREDTVLGCIGREAIIQAWEAVERDLFRTAGSSTMKQGERFERLFRDMSQAASHQNPRLKEPTYRNLAKDVLGVA